MGFVDELVAARDLVRAAEHTCVLDPRDITTLPAVWIRFDGLGGPMLSGGSAGRSRVLITVFCIVQPTDPQRDLEALEPFLETVSSIIPPLTDPKHVGVLLPGHGTAAPAMSYTHDLTID
jgi:hypothetical protein